MRIEFPHRPAQADYKSPIVYFPNPASYRDSLPQPPPHGFVDNLWFFHMWKVPRIFDYDQLGIRDSFGQNRAGILQWHRFICISTYNEAGTCTLDKRSVKSSRKKPRQVALLA